MFRGEASVFFANRTDDLHASEDYTTIDVLSLGSTYCFTKIDMEYITVYT